MPTTRYPDRTPFRPMKTKTVEKVTYETVVDYDAYWRINWRGEPDPDGSWWFDKEDFPEVVDAVLYFKAWEDGRRQVKEKAEKATKARRKEENRLRRELKAGRQAEAAKRLAVGFAEHQAKRAARETG